MPVFLKALAGSAMAGVKANPAGYLVKVARGGFTGSLSAIAFLWYTGWRRERVEPGSGLFPFPGISKLSKQFSSSLTDEPFPEDIAGVSNSPTSSKRNATKKTLDPGVIGVGISPGATTKTKHEPFDPLRYQRRYHNATRIANQFKLHITSGHRTAQHNAAVGGVQNSLHIDGLAFDMVGDAANMSRALRFGQDHPEMFSEVLVHNVGSGYHVHLGFWPGAGL